MPATEVARNRLSSAGMYQWRGEGGGEVRINTADISPEPLASAKRMPFVIHTILKLSSTIWPKRVTIIFLKESHWIVVRFSPEKTQCPTCMMSNDYNCRGLLPRTLSKKWTRDMILPSHERVDRRRARTGARLRSRFISTYVCTWKLRHLKYMV